MDHFAGLDVSVNETSVCIVDDTGRIVREVKVASEPEALLRGSTTAARSGRFSTSSLIRASNLTAPANVRYWTKDGVIGRQLVDS
jgi:hypothetical protein